VAPILDQLHGSGNMGLIAEYFRESRDPVHTIGDGYRAVAAQFWWRAEWLSGAPRRNPFTGEPGYVYAARAPVLLLPVAVAAALLWRRVPDVRRLVVVVASALVLGVIAVARILGPVYEYRLRWTWVLAMSAAVLAGWAVATYVPRRGLVVGAGAGLLVLAAVNGVSAARGGMLHARDSSVLRVLTPQVLAGLPGGRGDVVLRQTSFGSTFYRNGLLLQLERRGVAARVTGGSVAVGSHRVHRRGPVRADLTVAIQDDVERFAARPDLRLVAYWGTRTRADRARVVARLRDLAARNAAGELSDAGYYVAAARLRLGDAVAVFGPRVPAP
jgi:hypothetical protein